MRSNVLFEFNVDSIWKTLSPSPASGMAMSPDEVWEELEKSVTGPKVGDTGAY